MSILPAIAVYAAISKELGLPLRFPGKPGAYDVDLPGDRVHALCQRRPVGRRPSRAAANEAFNITNGDYFRWSNVWPKLAAVFDMPVGESADHQPDPAHGGQGAAVARHDGESTGSSRYAFDQLVAWPFADYVFGCDWDVMSDVTKSRQFGFHDVVDSEAMFVRLLGRFRKERIVP